MVAERLTLRGIRFGRIIHLNALLKWTKGSFIACGSKLPSEILC